MSKAAELAALIANVNNGSSLANKNLVINGAMNVSQRGTSFSFAHDGTTNSYTLDRFAFIVQNTDEFDGTLTQATDVPSGEGFVNSLKWTTGTAESAFASNEVAYIEHKVEAQNVAGLRYGTADAKPVTLSFWVKSSITGTFNTGIYQSDGSRIMTKTYTISSANTWEYKTLTFAGDTGGTINDDNGEGLRPIWNIFAGGDYTSSDSTSWGSYSTATWGYGHAQNAHATTAGSTFLLTGVQLEVGEKATEFEVEPFSESLKKCQRYYFRIEGDDIDGGKYATHYRRRSAPGQWYTDTQVISIFDFPVPMRAAPTALEQNGTDSDYDFVYRNTSSTASGSVIAFDSASQYACSITQTGHTDNNAQGEAGFQRIRQAAGYLGWSAEL